MYALYDRYLSRHEELPEVRGGAFTPGIHFAAPPLGFIVVTLTIDPSFA